jgi:hypothetical protein
MKPITKKELSLELLLDNLVKKYTVNDKEEKVTIRSLYKF